MVINKNILALPNQYYALIYNHRIEQWLEFRNPVGIFQANTLSEVIPSIQKIEASINDHDLYAAGFVSYESASAFDSALRVKNVCENEFPLLWFGLFPRPEIVCLDRKPNPDLGNTQPHWMPSVSKFEYDKCIQRIKQLISDGDTYQVNYTYRLRSAFYNDPFLFFCSIVGDCPPPYACYFQTSRWAISSFSPELFFELDGNRLLCRPMKGTFIRGRTAEEDDVFAQYLFNSKRTGRRTS